MRAIARISKWHGAAGEATLLAAQDTSLSVSSSSSLTLTSVLNVHMQYRDEVQLLSLP